LFGDAGFARAVANPLESFAFGDPQVSSWDITAMRQIDVMVLSFAFTDILEYAAANLSEFAPLTPLTTLARLLLLTVVTVGAMSCFPGVLWRFSRKCSRS
jgi:hypothetical protein